MRIISSQEIVNIVSKLCFEASYDLPHDVEDALNEAVAQEKSNLARQILRELIKNAEIARTKQIPLCQDTGMAVIFLEIGQEVSIEGADLCDAVNEGVRLGYKDLRKSMVVHPFRRINTKDNTPADIHIDIVPGERLKITVLPKGGGAENASFMNMFLPTTPIDKIANYIVEKVKENGPKACPPLIIGIGLGGAFDSAPILAKKALLRPVLSHNSGKDMKDLEKLILTKINKTGIGAMGVGGNITALAVHIKEAPCHITGLPVAVNITCHSHRHKTAVI